MAGCSKAHAFKAALFVCFLLLLLNILNSHLDARSKESFSFSHSSHHWPKGARIGSASSPQSHNNSNNIYTLVWNADNTSLRNITFHSPLISSQANNGILLIDSSDFKRKFHNHKLNPQNQTQLMNATKHTTTSPEAVEVTTKSGLIDMVMTTLGFKMCPLVPPNLDGPIEVNTTSEQMEIIEQRYQNILLPGGWYRPKECRARDRVAIIVPFRDRYAHLPIFLKNLHPFLMKQQIEYGIFIVEQTNGKLFNRAALMNVGFLEASKLFAWDCFVFHDVDLLPLDDRNLYTCPDQPRHMSVAIDIFGYKLPYSSIFGGVSAMTKSQFNAVNGFSNSFWGWGGEDDDMSNSSAY
ncbi:beta-1,4-N-acetylgalactosaminyltransferase bre-4 isoform X2 [Hermetia illucens]|uniref:beta-1,4-N-acetylgalactosaminyltransferase bre-4 isoform X2 n=1 Tax=Hermetia illucens TaxID=343691 RepID=UPI0018CC584E|nr:beta-1,4-N-acetylgalactosaminyltransferase bre-4 isoform X2 [Hermetia illucens]